ncbi:MAG: hypothetical protein ACE5D6_04955, partial [Candidatus Zixiibacteriota bacterium]
MKGITRDCLVEMIDRKILFLFAVVTILGVVVIFFSGSMAINIDVQSQGDISSGQISDIIGNPLLRVFSSFMSFLVILAVLVTGGLIPNMLIKGRADYILSKPISRSSLIYNKIFGIWVVYGAVIVVCGLIGYVALYFIQGAFDTKIIFLFIINLISFFIWLSITAFAGITFGSYSFAMVGAFLIWIAQLFLRNHDIISGFVNSKPVEIFLDILYYLIPKTGEISDLTLKAAMGNTITD